MEEQPASASRARRADARRNHDAILRTAREAFETRGSAAPLEEIAARAGVAIGTLYGHFPTRESLIEAATRDGLDALIAFADEVAVTDEPLSALRGWTMQAVRYCSTFRGLMGLLTRSRHGKGALSGSCIDMYRCGAALLHAAQAAGRVRPDFTADDLFEIISAAAWVRECSPADRDGSTRMLDLLLNATVTDSAGRIAPNDPVSIQGSL
ncbi:TetR family transcriptional regulator [Protofrankia sp. BMG5.30]|uniref:TetR family transcriptional regulator n=1 Tax=Protofrankia coriariae TaxID=1562887 RepID=A0ABR5F113_9ACTN|nr:TetR family transcriptional regulator [Protofrankia coriariae]ONH33552.1 TetR family transcriptional regulator [Protofrankia sp. BMG5.30]